MARRFCCLRRPRPRRLELLFVVLVVLVVVAVLLVVLVGFAAVVGLVEASSCPMRTPPFHFQSY